MQDYKENSRRAFDRQAPTYDTASFGSHARGLYPILLSQLAQIPRRRVLDVGCGTGELRLEHPELTASYLLHGQIGLLGESGTPLETRVALLRRCADRILAPEN